MATDRPIIMPFVHANGTSAEELIAVREDAYTALLAAFDALKKMGPNGRDYYPIPGAFEQAVKQHESRQTALSDLMEDLEAECRHIAEYGR